MILLVVALTAACNESACDEPGITMTIPSRLFSGQGSGHLTSDVAAMPGTPILSTEAVLRCSGPAYADVCVDAGNGVVCSDRVQCQDDVTSIRVTVDGEPVGDDSSFRIIVRGPLDLRVESAVVAFAACSDPL